MSSPSPTSTPVQNPISQTMLSTGGMTDNVPNEPRTAINCSCISPPSGRNLVVCIDGTSNQFSKNNSHVIELYSRLEKNKNQLTYYNSGIGTYVKESKSIKSLFSLRAWRQTLDHTIDTAIAWNFKSKVLSAYQWLSENYQPGDQIFLFGFSRGAYQVRVIAGMIDRVGLLHKGNEEQIPFAYELYRDSVFTLMRTSPQAVPQDHEQSLCKHFKDTFSQESVTVHFVGAWDTVSSVGVFRGPTLPETTTGMKHVCAFRHALALDELRVKFLPEYANGGAGPGITSTHVKEVWFAGVHSDIGGGSTPNLGRSRFGPPLRWMLYEAIQCGLRTRAHSSEWSPTKRTDSMKFAWKILEYLPLARLAYKTHSRTKTNTVLDGSEDSVDSATADTVKFWPPHRMKPRRIQKGQYIHESVLEQLGPEYTPKASFSSVEMDWSKTSLEKLCKQNIANKGPSRVIEIDTYMRAEYILSCLKGFRDSDGDRQMFQTLVSSESGKLSIIDVPDAHIILVERLYAECQRKHAIDSNNAMDVIIKGISAFHLAQPVVLTNVMDELGTLKNRIHSLKDENPPNIRILDQVLDQLEEIYIILLQSLAASFKSQDHTSGDVADLDVIQQKLQATIQMTPAGNPEKAGLLQNLGMCFSYQYRKSGNPDNLYAALQNFDQALDLIPEGNQERVGLLQSLGQTFSDKYRRKGDLDDLGAALQKFQEALQLLPDGHPERPQYMKGLGEAWQHRYQRLGNLQDLTMALQAYQVVLDLTPEGHPSRAECLNRLAATLTEKYRRFGKLEDLEAALHAKQQAVGLTPDNHPDKAGRLQSLGISFTDQYHRRGNLEDLEAALHTHQQAVALTPDNHPDKAGRLQSLGVSFTDQYQRLGNLEDLEAALHAHRQAVALTPDDHPDKAGCFRSLGVAFADRYRRLGNLEDLEAALHAYQQSVALTPDDHPDKAGRFRSLGVAFSDRYQRLGNIEDLEAAFNADQQSVALTPDDHPDKAGRLQNLGISFTKRYQRLGNLEDLEAALRAHRQAVTLTPDDHPDKAGCLQSLGISLTDQYKSLGNLEDLEAALHAYQRAVALTPDGHPDKAGLLESFSRFCTMHYESLRDPNDLEAATLVKQQAENLTENLADESSGPTHPPESEAATSLGMEQVSQGNPPDSA